MNQSCCASTAGGCGAPQNPGALVAAIDKSGRVPLAFLFYGAAIWLVAGSVFSLLASLHFHSPALMSHSAWLGYGRLLPAGREAVLYGFCIPATLGASLWLFARLGRAPIALPVLVVAGAVFWNLGVAVGLFGILRGDRSGFAGLDFPHYAAPVLFAGYLLLGLSAALTFHQRTEKTLFVSQWFLLAALFWFPWIFTTGEYFLGFAPVRGVAQAIIAWWYDNNLESVYLWLSGLGLAFYLIPKITGAQLHTRYFSLLVFWSVILFASWGGVPGSAPLPAWITVLSQVFTLVTLVAVLSVWLIARWTFRAAPPGGLAASGQGGATAIRFVKFGVFAFVLSGLMRVVAALPGVNSVTDLTWFGPAQSQLNLLGFFGMTAFGAIYYILPRAAGYECLCPKGARFHFWLSACGILLTVIPEAVGGVLQGLKLADPQNSFLAVSGSTLTFLRVASLGLTLVAVAQLAFLVNLSMYALGTVWARANALRREATADVFKPAGAKR